MTPEEYAQCDAIALGQHLSNRDVSQTEVIDIAADIIDKLDGSLNAVVARHIDFAHENAATCAANGPFYGVPFGAKEEGAYYNGVSSGAASKLVNVVDPQHDTNFVSRYKASGLNLIAKLNMPELAANVSTDSSVHGPCNNPWDTTKSPGGSSGGSAAAVAAGYFPAAYGNDGAGSIRIPASCCGVFGLKPSRGRVPKGPMLNEEWAGNVVDHVLTRSVRDSAAILDCTAGPDIGAPYSAPPIGGTFMQSALKVPERPLHIALCTEAFTGGDVHEDCTKAAEHTAKLCEGLGHNVTLISSPLDGEAMFADLFTLMSANISREIGGLFSANGIAPHPDYVEATNFAFFEHGQKISAVDYLDTTLRLAKLSRAFSSFMDGYDLLLTPTLALPNTAHGYVTTADDQLDRFWGRWKEFIPFTPIANISGQPAMSVPLYWNDSNCPIGAHFIAPYGREDTLFSLAGQLEQAQPWAKNTPPLHANFLTSSL